MKFSIKDFFSKCDQSTFTEEILNGKLHFLSSEYSELKVINKTDHTTITIKIQKDIAKINKENKIS